MREVGPFELLEPLGAGGMGEVFKARDKRLNRFVAIKFLPESAPAAARERFQREAQAIAALNHPHICTLYEIGEDQGRPYLVLELLEGETLHARLARGPVGLPQLVQWGGEIADALQAAHAKGILHRDLKPGNIFVTRRGTAKVLDFGLAQMAVAAAADADAATVAAGGAGLPPLTTPGTTLGTYAYMSPEQARGEPTDARSDIFSLGVVLYEMAGGRAPFQGRTSADLTAAILMLAPPPPSSLRAEIPPRLDDIIAQCLEKDPDLRYQSATELRVSLRRVLGSAPSSSTGMAAPALPTPAPAARRRWLWPAVTAVVIMGAGLAWWRLGPRAPAAPPTLQFRQLTFSGQVVDAAISPDGKFLAHVDAGPQGTSLHLLSIGSGSDVQIVPPGGGCCESPAFSPDGNQVYFLQNRVLQSVPVLGGAVRTIADGVCSGAGFSPDGDQIAYVSGGVPSVLMVARPDGSQAHALNRAPAGDGYLSQCWVSIIGAISHPPAWSPDGRWIALADGPTSGSGHLTLVGTRDGRARTLGPAINFAVSDASWLPDGGGLVFTASIPDSATAQVWEMAYPSGRITQLTNELQGYADASVSRDGQLELVHSAPQYSIWVQARAGGAFQELPGGGAMQDGAGGVAWTPQGGLVSVRKLGKFDEKGWLWVENSDGSGARALPIAGAPDGPRLPSIAPNGQIVFVDIQQEAVWRVNGDGTGLTQLVHPPVGGEAVSVALARGGQQVVYLFVDKQGAQTLWAVPLAGGAPRQLWPGDVYSGVIPVSPDGNRLFVIKGSATSATVRAPVILRIDGATPQVTPVALDLKTVRSPYGWTPDGGAITYINNQGATDNIWAFPLGGGKPYALTHFTDLRIRFYAFSPDGRLAISRGTPGSDAVVATGLIPAQRR